MFVLAVGGPVVCSLEGGSVGFAWGVGGFILTNVTVSFLGEGNRCLTSGREGFSSLFLRGRSLSS